MATFSAGLVLWSHIMNKLLTFFLWRSLSPQTTELQFQTLIPSIVPRMGTGFKPQWSWGKIYEIFRTVFKALKFSFSLFNKKHFLSLRTGIGKDWSKHCRFDFNIKLIGKLLFFIPSQLSCCVDMEVFNVILNFISSYSKVCFWVISVMSNSMGKICDLRWWHKQSSVVLVSCYLLEMDN